MQFNSKTIKPKTKKKALRVYNDIIYIQSD